MVVCKCRKATRQYCFVHKVGVCGECICYPEHQICVVNKYSDWVINGEYCWPPKCAACNSELEEGKNDTTRLGCLHVMHTNCLVSHIQNFPPQTAPAGYICPACSTPIWPPTSIKDTGSALHSKLKEAIIQTGSEKNVFGNHVIPAPTRSPPPAFASEPLVPTPSPSNGPDSFRGPSASFSVLLNSEPEIVEVDEGGSSSNNKKEYVKSSSPIGPSAVTRKAPQFDRQTSEISYYADDEDGNSKKYVKRGSFRHRFLRMLLPFWSSALPTLPVTAPPRKDGSDASDTRVRHNKSAKLDPRKILLFIALLACMATMVILYYRLAQRSFGDDLVEEEAQ